MSRSLVAGVNALFRARESARRSGRVLDDAWAGALAERDLRVSAIRYARFVVPTLYATVRDLQTAHVVRHRAIDEIVLRAARDGFAQFVVVGAGYDTRRFRFARQLDGARWIEADHPDTQARKWRRLDGRRGARGHVERAPTDLMRESLAQALDRTGFDRGAATCFVAEGLIHYLDAPHIEDLFATFARPSRSRVVLSFIDEEMVRRASSTFVQLIKAVREIPSSYFFESEMAALAARHGFAKTRVWPYAQQVDDFAVEARGRPVPRLTQHVAQIDR